MTKFIDAIIKLFSILIQAFVSLNKKILNFKNRERKNPQTNRLFSEKVFRLAIVLLVLVSAFNFDYELVVGHQIAQVVDVISKTNKNIVYSQLLFTTQGLFEITPISYWQAPPLLIASNNQLEDYISKRSQLLTKHIEHLQLFEKIRN